MRLLVNLLLKSAGSMPYRDAATPRGYGRHWTPVHLDFVVVAAGATLERDVEHAAWGSICHLADPFGHGFCLLRFTAAGYTALETVA